MLKVVARLSCLSLALAPLLPARGDIVPATGSTSLNTIVNGNAPGGGCSSGSCEISGGTRRGGNLFHRFDQFDTRGVSDIVVLNGSATSVIMAVTGINGAHIASPIALGGGKASLYFLSPNGINILRGASFQNVNSLVLTTSGRLRLGSDLFDYAVTSAGDLAASEPAFTVSPSEDLGFPQENLLEGVGEGFFSAEKTASGFSGIKINEGVSLSVDKSLLIIANKSPVKIVSGDARTVLEAKGGTPYQIDYQIDYNYQAGDGISVIGQNIQITGSKYAPVGLISNAAVVIREPFPEAVSYQAPQGALASTQTKTYGFSGTHSQLVLRNVDFFTGSNPAPYWVAELRATGLVCNGNAPGCGSEVMINDGLALARIGRKCVWFSDDGDPVEVSQALYAGINADNLRVISGYTYSDAKSYLLAPSASSDAAELYFDLTATGARLNGLGLFKANGSSNPFGNSVSITIGGYPYPSGLGDFAGCTSAGAIACQIVNFAMLPFGDPAIYVFPYLDSALANPDDNGGYTVNSITFQWLDPSSALLQEPQPQPQPQPQTQTQTQTQTQPVVRPQVQPQPQAQVSPQASTSDGRSGLQALDSVVISATENAFDNVVLKLGQSVADDYEGLPVTSSRLDAGSSGQIDLAPGVSLFVRLDADRDGASGPSAGEPGTGETSVDPKLRREGKAKSVSYTHLTLPTKA